MEKRYPFKFLDAYRKEDIAFFFGREEEIEALYSMVFQTKILVVYGGSGTGKTSLIQCGLASKFQSYDWLELYIRRGNHIIASLDKALCDKSDEAFSYTEQTEPVIGDLAKKIEAVYRASFKPVYLIFDQFEELYVLGDKREQQHFERIIHEILQIEQPVKIIISVREEYLGHLYELERVVPELMRKKLRVEPMHLEKVESVIRNVGQQSASIISLQAGEEAAIAVAIFNKIRGKNAITVELPYLQVFLDKFYLQITHDETRKAEAAFSLAALRKMGDIGDVLRDFLDEQAVKIARELEQTPDTIWGILSPFVTLEGTKEPLSATELQYRRPDTPAAQLVAVLQAMVKGRILRYTEHDERYEIAHDSLARQVAAKRSDEEIALLEVQRLIKSQVALKEETRDYFSEKQLVFMEPYLGKFRPNTEEQAWIEQSRTHWAEEREAQARREREELEKAKAQAERERAMRVVAEQAKEEAEIQRVRAEQKTRQARQRTRLAVVLALLAVVVAAWAYILKIEADHAENAANEAEVKAQRALIDAYESEVERYKGEKKMVNVRLKAYKLYEAPDSIVRVDSMKADSLETKISELQKKISDINTKIDQLKQK